MIVLKDPKSISFRYDQSSELVLDLNKSALDKTPKYMREAMSKLIDEALDLHKRLLKLGEEYQKKHPLKVEDIKIEPRL